MLSRYPQKTTVRKYRYFHQTFWQISLFPPIFGACETALTVQFFDTPCIMTDNKQPSLGSYFSHKNAYWFHFIRALTQEPVIFYYRINVLVILHNTHGIKLTFPALHLCVHLVKTWLYPILPPQILKTGS